MVVVAMADDKTTPIVGVAAVGFWFFDNPTTCSSLIVLGTLTCAAADDVGVMALVLAPTQSLPLSSKAIEQEEVSAANLGAAAILGHWGTGSNSTLVIFTYAAASATTETRYYQYCYFFASWPA